MGAQMRERGTITMRRTTVTNYREDPLYPRIVRATAKLLSHGRVVAPVDVLVAMGVLAPDRLEDWRRGRVPYLERVIDCNLERLSRLLRILRFHAHDLNLVPSWTAYVRWGKGPQQRLRFSKSGERPLEEAYSTHFLRPEKKVLPEFPGEEFAVETSSSRGSHALRGSHASRGSHALRGSHASHPAKSAQEFVGAGLARPGSRAARSRSSTPTFAINTRGASHRRCASHRPGRASPAPTNACNATVNPELPDEPKKSRFENE
jgi:hypothetical protein